MVVVVVAGGQLQAVALARAWRGEEVACCRVRVAGRREGKADVEAEGEGEAAAALCAVGALFAVQRQLRRGRQHIDWRRRRLESGEGTCTVQGKANV